MNIRILLSVALLATTATAVAADKSPAADETPAALVELLKSSSPAQEKAIACKKLAIRGNQDAVPALAPLLADEQLSSWARIALEAIPGSAANDALRAAMGQLKGRLLVGVINSLAVRCDTQAVELLIQRLKDSDADVASAAAVALGRIGGPSAVASLQASLTTTTSVRSAVAIGCILCAEKSLAEGKAAEAINLYDVVRAADVPLQRTLEATRGAILARGSAGVPLLVQQLRSSDKPRFALGLRVARELTGREVSDAILAELKRTAPERQALLLLVLADRGDTTVLPNVVQLAQTGPEEVRITAIRVLTRLGNASCVPVLLGAAVEVDGPLSQTAIQVLTDLPGQDVDRDLAARLADAEGKARQVLIGLVGQRHITSAVPTLRKAVDDPDAQVREAALTALGATIEMDDLSVLIARVAEAKHADDAAPAAKALSTACRRMPDQDACAQSLITAMADSPTPLKCRVLEILSEMGGQKALAAMAAAAKDPDAEVQDAASRLLGSWMSVEAGPVLLELAKTLTDEKYKTRAIRGYIRLVRQFTMSDEDRCKMCLAAMGAAHRDAEKKLVLEVVERYPHANLLPLTLEAAKTQALKNEAVRALLSILPTVGGRSAEVQQMLAQIGQGPLDVEIVKAEYGAGQKVKDVTEILRQHTRGFPIIVLSKPRYNASFGGDPAPNTPKQLKIQYRMNGKAGEVTFKENASITLPMPK